MLCCVLSHSSAVASAHAHACARSCCRPRGPEATPTLYHSPGGYQAPTFTAVAPPAVAMSNTDSRASEKNRLLPNVSQVALARGNTTSAKLFVTNSLCIAAMNLQGAPLAHLMNVLCMHTRSQRLESSTLVAHSRRDDATNEGRSWLHGGMRINEHLLNLHSPAAAICTFHLAPARCGQC